MRLLFKIMMAGAALLSAAMAATAQTPTAGEEIDLGLSVNWRGWNMGASAPGEYGDTYAWGDLAKGGYDSVYSYPFCVIDWDIFERVIKLPSENIAGDVQYDAAAAMSNGVWTMPTKAQWQELIDNCDVTTVNGDYLFTSRLNGNSILLPRENKYWNDVTYYTSESTGTQVYKCDIIPAGATIGLTDVYSSMGSSYYGPWNGKAIRPVCTKGGIALESIELTIAKSEVWAGTATAVTATPVPADAKFMPAYSSSDNAIATVDEKGNIEAYSAGTVTITVTSGGKSASVELTVTAVENPADDGTVDMGLSVLWLTTNLGATTPQDKGDLYMFAYTEPGSLGYEGRDDYMFANGQYSFLFPKQNFCGDPDYDAVTAKYGVESKRRLPSTAELKELYDNCHIQTVKKGSDDYYARFTSLVNGRQMLLYVGYGSVRYYSGCTNDSKTNPIVMGASQNNGIVKVSAPSTYYDPYYGYPMRGVQDRNRDCELTVNVTDEDGNPIAGATVAVAGATYTTDTAGQAQIAVKEALGTSENVTVSAEGYNDKSVTADFSTEQTVTLNVTLEAYTDYIDLGLSVKWARHNVGAATADGVGTYFQFANPDPTLTKWGLGTTPYSKYDYNLPVMNMQGTEYDPATVNEGDGWMTPTEAQWQELLDNCDMQADGNGFTFTSRINGAMIYFPKTGRVTTSTTPGFADNGMYMTAAVTGGTSVNTAAGFTASIKYVTMSKDKAAFESSNYSCYGYVIRPVVKSGDVSTDATFDITVTDDTDEHEPVGGATVTIGIYVCTLDADGHMSETLEGFNGCKVPMMIVKQGYVNTKAEIDFTDGTGMAKLDVTMERNPTFPEVIDLGLSVEWAGYNIGATSLDLIGTYFQFANPDATLTSWEVGTSPYATDGQIPVMNMQGTEYDPATVNLGDGWMTPSLEQFNELYENCDRKSVPSGIQFTSRINGESILFPATGQMVGTSKGYGTSALYMTCEAVGGTALSASYGTQGRVPGVIVGTSSSYSRLDCILTSGLAIRPVRVKPVNCTATFKVMCHENKPLQGAVIAVEDVDGTVTTDAAGEASMELPGSYGRTHNVTITHKNHLPYTGTLDFTENTAVHHLANMQFDVNTGIEDVSADSVDGDTEYYNLQGIRVEHPTPGLYIRRAPGVPAVKVVVK